MSDPTDADRASVPRAVLLLPVALGIHIAEEWFGGFPDWARLSMGMNIDHSRFLSVNLVGFVLFSMGAIVAYREPRAAWIGVSLAALVGLNAILHAVLSFTVGSYSPGTITGLLMYLPVSVIILRWAGIHLSRRAFSGAILLGFGIHAVATVVATLQR